MAAATAAPEQRAGYGQLFAVAEFRALYVARTLSLLGDQLARVALAVLVFNETHSAFMTGLVYALTFLPYVGGLLLAGLADRRPRRAVLICGDLISTVAIGAMAIPGLPLPVLCALLVIAMLVNPVYDAARAALLPEVLPGDLYVMGSAITSMTFGAVQVLGFGLGGALIAVVGPRPALALDALTFVASAVVLRLWTKRREAASTSGERPVQQLANGARLVFGAPQLRRLVWLAWLNAFWIVPEGLAAPYAHSLHGGAITTGLLLAAAPTGMVVGSFALARFVEPELRIRLIYPLAALAAAPLTLVALHPDLPAALVLWCLSGVGAAYNLPANAVFMRALPNARRGQGFALAQAGIITGQGVAILVAGAAAAVIGSSSVIALSGGLGLAAVCLVAIHGRSSLGPLAEVPSLESSSPVLAGDITQ
jgi:MFS family permease